MCQCKQIPAGSVDSPISVCHSEIANHEHGRNNMHARSWQESWTLGKIVVTRWACSHSRNRVWTYVGMDNKVTVYIQIGLVCYSLDTLD